MLSIIDAIIILFLLVGAVIGFKKGVIKSVVSCLGMLVVVILSLILKNPVSVFLYTYFPFFNIGLEALNIIIYEGIAFLLVFVILLILLKIIIKLSGVLENILKFTVILAVPSKILGAIFGFLEYYIFAFIILFILMQFNFSNSILNNSILAEKIISQTPLISNIADKSYSSIKEIIELNSKYDAQEQDKFNQDTIEILLKYKIISVENLEKLIDKGKIESDNTLKNILDKYREE